MNAHQVRVVVTGLDDRGRGCVVAEDPLRMELADGLAVWHTTAYAQPSSPLPPAPQGRAPLMDVQVPAGSACWLVMDYEPGEHQDMHHTDTVDLDIVLTGSIELILDDGAHRLEAGDAAVINGIDHGWRAGPQGCRLSVTFLGTPPSVGTSA